MKDEKINISEGLRSSATAVLVSRLIGPLSIAISFVCMAAWTWRRWPALVVDFGNELYIPWQLAEGKILYKDIAFFHGPLSKYFNAVLFKICGVSLSTLIWSNLLILAVMTAIIYILLARATSRFAATASCLVVVLIFAFSQYSTLENYNFICPYTHEATHGVALSWAMIFFLVRSIKHKSIFNCAAAGLCLGLVFLTTGEVFTSALAAALCWAVLIILVREVRTGAAAPQLLMVFFSALIPPLGIFLYFLGHMTAGEALHAVAAFWYALIEIQGQGNLYYAKLMGLDNLSDNLILMDKMFLYIISFMAVIVASDISLKRLKISEKISSIVCAIAVFAILYWQSESIPWRNIPRALPLILTIIFIIIILTIVKGHRDIDLLNRLVPLAMINVFALALLGRMILAVRFDNYGFYLALPGAVFMTGFILWALPDFIKTRSAAGRVTLWSMSAVIAACMVFHLQWSREFYSLKSYRLGQGGDAIITYRGDDFSIGPIVEQALSYIEFMTPAGSTLAALPEGVMLNYLTRRVNPTPYISLMVPEIQMYGEDRIIEAFRKNPPDYILLVHKDSKEYGVGYFGKDPRNGQKLMTWVNDNYRSLVLFGYEPFEGEPFGIKIMKKGFGGENGEKR